MTSQLPSRAPSAPAVSYEVLDQVPATRANARGQAVPGVDVLYRTAAGVQGQVFVENTRFTPDNVRAAIVSKVSVHDQVGKLTG